MSGDTAYFYTGVASQRIVRKPKGKGVKEDPESLASALVFIGFFFLGFLLSLFLACLFKDQLLLLSHLTTRRIIMKLAGHPLIYGDVRGSQPHNIHAGFPTTGSMGSRLARNWMLVWELRMMGFKAGDQYKHVTNTIRYS